MSFNPKPYDFQIEDTQSSSPVHKEIGPDECLQLGITFPKFNVWFDHTLAVVWICLSPNYRCNSLTVSQIEWAIAFLRSMRTIDRTQNPHIVKVIRRLEKLEAFLHLKKTPKISNSMPMMETERRSTGVVSKKPSSLELLATESLNWLNVVSRFCSGNLVHLLGITKRTRSM